MADMWRVTEGGQSKRTELAPTGNTFRDVWEITYEITAGPAAGVSGTVRIPVAQYTVDTVRDTIQAEVERITAVAEL